MRIVFMGTGDIAIPAFRSLIRHSDLAGLVTQPDRPVGRHQVLTAPAIKNIAREAGIPVLQPHSLRSPDALSNLRRLNPDLIVVMAYGQILSQEVIDMAPMGCINAHASLLPRHRGAACIQSAIKSGDAETGITIMHIVRKLDAGDIIAQISTPLEGTETGGSLHDKLARMTPDVLLPVIHSIEKGTATRIRQQEILATYAPKLLRADGKIDWTRPAEEIGRMIRAYDPWPGHEIGGDDADATLGTGHGHAEGIADHRPVAIGFAQPADLKALARRVVHQFVPGCSTLRTRPEACAVPVARFTTTFSPATTLPVCVISTSPVSTTLPDSTS